MLKKLLILIFLTWIGGFFIYLYQINHFTNYPISADGIVILTGGRDRIEKGLRLLNVAPEKPLLITGVRTKGQLQEVASTHSPTSQIDLGFKATTTRENAQEIAEWNKIKLCKSLLVVTSHYHMPRSLLELQAALPTVKLIPYSIVSSSFQKRKWLKKPYFLYLLFKEYNKYLVVLSEMYLKS
ncbi:MAG: YdcF family protein [Alphaproteobacteria bacterium]